MNVAFWCEVNSQYLWSILTYDGVLTAIYYICEISSSCDTNVEHHLYIEMSDSVMSKGCMMNIEIERRNNNHNTRFPSSSIKNCSRLATCLIFWNTVDPFSELEVYRIWHGAKRILIVLSDAGHFHLKCLAWSLLFKVPTRNFRIMCVSCNSEDRYQYDEFTMLRIQWLVHQTSNHTRKHVVQSII